jgi:hypothetical protein
MKRRDFIKTAGIATVTGLGVAGLSSAGVKNEEHIPWEEIDHVIKDCGFPRNIYSNTTKESLGDMAIDIKTQPDDIRRFYNKFLSNGSQYHLNFERIENVNGENKLTFVYLAFQEILGDGSRGMWTEHPIKRFYLDPQNWEAELREVITLGLSKKFNS